MDPDWRAIESELPGVGIRSVARLGEGWTAHAYLVNEELVFKFPKRADDWGELDREIAFLAYARPLLPVPVAEHLQQMGASRGAPHGYAVYRYLPGRAVAGPTLSRRDRSVLVADLARFLRALHELMPEPGQPASLTSLSLPQKDEREVAALFFHEAREKISPQLTAAERRRLDHVVTSHIGDPANFPATPRILHADLSSEHVLHDRGTVTGILDWGDVNLGDPDYDFNYLDADMGGEFVRDVAREYGHSDIDRLLRKTYYFRVIDQIDTIVYGSGRALPGQEAAAWQRLRVWLGPT